MCIYIKIIAPRVVLSTHIFQTLPPSFTPYQWTMNVEFELESLHMGRGNSCINKVGS